MQWILLGCCCDYYSAWLPAAVSAAVATTMVDDVATKMVATVTVDVTGAVANKVAVGVSTLIGYY